jgi:hypothetical protein
MRLSSAKLTTAFSRLMRPSVQDDTRGAVRRESGSRGFDDHDESDGRWRMMRRERAAGREYRSKARVRAAVFTDSRITRHNRHRAAEPRRSILRSRGEPHRACGPVRWGTAVRRVTIRSSATQSVHGSLVSRRPPSSKVRCSEDHPDGNSSSRWAVMRSFASARCLKRSSGSSCKSDSSRPRHRSSQRSLVEWLCGSRGRRLHPADAPINANLRKQLARVKPAKRRRNGRKA